MSRRVEFKVMLLGGQKTGVSLGCAAAVSHGITPEGVPATAPRRSGAGAPARAGVPAALRLR